MKKRKFKDFLKGNWYAMVFVFGLVLVAFSLSTLMLLDISIWVKVILNSISIIYAVVGYKLIKKSIDKEKAQKAEARENQLTKSEKSNKYYVDLVNKQLQETLDRFKKEFTFVYDTSQEYLICFNDNKEWICQHRIVGKPDSFIIASCLMDSIMEHHLVILKGDEETAKLKDIEISINIDIAINCALEIISCPSTYYEESPGIWVEKKHSKVDIVVPKGLIKDGELFKRIVATIYCDECVHNRTSIMQFSNLLHLIYLNCQ